MKKTLITCLLVCTAIVQSENISVKIEVAFGELVDKITILEIKSKKIKDEAKLKNIRLELQSLRSVYKDCIKGLNEKQLEKLIEFYKNIKVVNKKLWRIEDALRDKERERIFDEEFIQLARSVYYQNDHRCHIKRKINLLIGSNIVEEKSYAAYN